MVYKADVLGSTSPHAIAAMDILNVQADVDAAALFGWEDRAIHGKLLPNHGSKLNRRVGTVQGISNIEVTQNAAGCMPPGWRTGSKVRIHGCSWACTTSLRVRCHRCGGHADPALVLDRHRFSQSGRNGPSIFPNLGVGVRVRQPIGQSGYLQLAVVDGAPGDPHYAGRTLVRLSRSDARCWWVRRGGNSRGIGGRGQVTGASALGNTPGASDSIDGGPPERNQGVYVLAQSLLGGSGAGRTTGFLELARQTAPSTASTLLWMLGCSSPPLSRCPVAAFP